MPPRHGVRLGVAAALVGARPPRRGQLPPGELAAGPRPLRRVGVGSQTHPCNVTKSWVCEALAAANWACHFASSRRRGGTARCLPPLPSPATAWRWSKSASPTRGRRHSRTRSPKPHINSAKSRWVPATPPNTTCSRSDLLARRSSTLGNSMSRTLWSKTKMAEVPGSGCRRRAVGRRRGAPGRPRLLARPRGFPVPLVVEQDVSGGPGDESSSVRRLWLGSRALARSRSSGSGGGGISRRADIGR